MNPKFPRIVILTLFLVAATFTTSLALALATPLDSAFGGFGSGGVHQEALPSNISGIGLPFVEQADGSLLTAMMQNDDFLLLRYMADGTPDTSFGVLPTDFDGQRDRPYAIAIQPDGKIIVSGAAEVGGNDDFALARYINDFTEPSSFSKIFLPAQEVGEGRGWQTGI